jgi:hypothetical protein
LSKNFANFTEEMEEKYHQNPHQPREASHEDMESNPKPKQMDGVHRRPKFRRNRRKFHLSTTVDRRCREEITEQPKPREETGQSRSFVCSWTRPQWWLTPLDPVTMGTSAETLVSARSPRTSKISDNQRRRIIEALEEKTERIQGGKITQKFNNFKGLT